MHNIVLTFVVPVRHPRALEPLSFVGAITVRRQFWGCPANGESP
jgi:hypothetical protein